MLCVYPNLDIQYRASTRLRYQWFEIRFEDESRSGTLLCRYLVYATISPHVLAMQSKGLRNVTWFRGTGLIGDTFMVAGRGESVGDHLLPEWGGGSSFGPSPLEPLCPGEIFADQRSLERNNL